MKMSQPQEIRTINLMPSWQSMAGLLVTLIENGDAEGRRTAIEELNKMAKLADAYVGGQSNEPRAG